jgi:hypothetical protein
MRNQRRRSICRATSEISGTARAPAEDSTNLVSFWASRRKNSRSCTPNASHSTSSSMNSTTASYPSAAAWVEIAFSPVSKST